MLAGAFHSSEHDYILFGCVSASGDIVLVLRGIAWSPKQAPESVAVKAAIPILYRQHDS